MLQLIVICFACSFVASALMLVLGNALLARSERYRRAGRYIYNVKIASMSTRWPITAIVRAIHEQNTTRGGALIMLLIGIKSLGCLITNVFALLWLPLAIGLMPAILEPLKQKRGDQHDAASSRWVGRVLLLQGSSHLVAAALGSAIVIQWFKGDLALSQLISDNAMVITITAATSLMLAIAAAVCETNALIHRDAMGLRASDGYRSGIIH